MTAKAVQDAIKAGVATSNLLQDEINRIEAREKRSKELDREKVQEKVQEKVHDLFLSQMNNEQQRSAMTTGDKIAAKLLLYQSLDYHAKEIFDKTVLKNISVYHSTPLKVFNRFAEMTAEEQVFLIRIALAHGSESKRLNHINGFCLYWIASNTNMDIEAIEQEQQDIATNREKKAQDRIFDLRKGWRN